ncbi:hypothetical protein BRD03_02905 [Halobacteriales archaeon QS_9_68_17]|nr:MAG: hypothetical protein BRD03_02905 [Halobacteriales archaeon QS_9_68_17]
MTDVSERVAVTCPSCSPDIETVHEVLKPGGQATVRCTECSHVHKTTVEEDEAVTRDVVVSQDGESFTATVDAPPEEPVAVGEEFVLDAEEAIMTVRITDLELGEQRRVEEAVIEDVDTLWTRAVDNVSVDATIHPKEGTGNREDTRSVEVFVPGDDEFTVGEVEEHGDEAFEVEGIVVRDDAEGYQFDKLDYDGDAAIAKDIKRLYGRDQTTTAWSAW